LFENFGLTRFSEFASKEHFIHDTVHLVEVEDEVELADVVEVFVENLDEVVNGFEVEEVVIGDVHADAEVETSVSPVDDFEIPKLHKVCMFGITHCDYGMNLLDKFLLLLVLKVYVPLGQPRLSRPVLNHDEFNPHVFVDFFTFLKLLKCYTQAV